MNINFTPNMGEFTGLKTFRHWCQKVLPAVYDDSLSYYELLCKVVAYLNTTMQNVNVLHDDVQNLYEAYTQLQRYVNNYFDNLDVQEEIDNKLDRMVEDGTLAAIVNKMVNAKFYDVADISIAGQVVTDDGVVFATQCFCADSEYVYVFCTVNSAETFILKYSKTLGTLLNKFELGSGTIGSCGINDDYLVGAHSHQDIYIMSKNGTILKTIAPKIRNPLCTCPDTCHCDCELCACGDEDNCFITIEVNECTCDGDYIYFTDTSTPNKLYKMDFDGNILRTTELSTVRNTVMQALKVIGDNLYMTNFDMSLRLYLVSIYTLEGTYITNISIPIKTELEDICEIDGQTYILVNNFGGGTIYRCTLQKYPLSTNYVSTHNQIKNLVNVVNDHYYFDNTKFNLWNDGRTPEKALNKIKNTYNLFHDYQSRLDIELLSDFPDGELVFRSNLSWFRIIGNNHSMRGLYIANNVNFEGRYINFIGRQFQSNEVVSITGGRAEFVNCTFTCESEARQLYTNGVTLSLTNCVFNGALPTNENIRCLMGQCELYGGLTINNFKSVIMREGVSINYTLTDTSWLSADVQVLNSPILGTNVRFSELKANGSYRLQINTVDVENGLAGLTHGGFAVVCSRANMTSIMLELNENDYMYNIIYRQDANPLIKLISTSIVTPTP